ncbi:unnamed protein product, partial [Phaeothamnion confervicola]
MEEAAALARKEEWARFYKEQELCMIAELDAPTTAERLFPLVRTHVQLQQFVTLVAAWQHQRCLGDDESKLFTKRVLEVAARFVPVCRDSYAVFMVALDRARNLEIIDAHEYYAMSGDAHVERVKNADFVKEMQDEIKQIAGKTYDLEEALFVFWSALEDLRKAHQAQLRAQAIAGLFKAVVNVLSLGAGGAVLDSAVAIALSQIVDIGDIEAAKKLLEVGCVAGFDAVAVLEEATGADNLKDLIFCGVDTWAGGVGDNALDKAAKEKIAVKLVAVAAAAVNVQPATDREGALPPLPEQTELAPLEAAVDGSSAILERSLLAAVNANSAHSGEADFFDAAFSDESIEAALAQCNLTRLTSVLVEHGFTTRGVLEELSAFGREEFLRC